MDLPDGPSLTQNTAVKDANWVMLNDPPPHALKSMKLEDKNMPSNPLLKLGNTAAFERSENIKRERQRHSPPLVRLPAKTWARIDKQEKFMRDV